MKKKLVFAMIFIFIFSFCFNFSNLKSVDAVYAGFECFEDFQKQFGEITADDNFDVIFIEEDEALSSLQEKLYGTPNDSISTFDVYNENAEILINDNNIVEICDAFDLVYNEIEGGYEVQSRYKFKRIIVTGNVTNSYGATTVLTYRNYNILSFETEEATKFAYENLSLDSSLIVALDDRVESLAESNVYGAPYDYSGYSNEWGTKAIDLGYYNDYLATNNSNQEVVVAVIDSGVYTSHSKFSGRILKNGYSNVGYADPNCGYYYNDGNGHGTHVAGIICDMTPSNVKILPMKVFADDGHSLLSYVTTALTALSSDVYEGYNIVAANLSLGNKSDLGAGLTDWIDSFTACFDEIREDGIMPVVAAGNSSSNTSRYVPAVCDNCITVSALYGPNTMVWNATTGKYQLNIVGNQDYDGDYLFDSAYSNFGSAVDISAPGTGILSSYKGGTTSTMWMAGTSQAAPHVAAAVALLSIDKLRPDQTITQIEDRLYSCTIDLGDPGEDIYYGHGMLNLKNFNGNISYSASDTVVTYDGNYHNISVGVTGVNNPIVTYGLTASNCNIADITTNDIFKNWTNGAKTIYFKISASGYADTIGYKTLTINKANIGLNVGSQSGEYGSVHTLSNSVYSVSSGIVYNSDNLGVTLTTSATRTSPVGFYKISATITNTNYNLSYNSTNLNYEVTRLGVNITLSPQQSEYGDAINLDNSAYTISALTPIVPGDDLQIVLQTNATSSSPLGNGYEITVVSNNSNYIVNAPAGIYSIVQKQLKITLSNSSNYGDSINLSTSNMTVRDSGNKIITYPNIDINVSCDLDETSPAGTYADRLIVSTTNTNYNITTQSYYYIYRRAITITPNRKEVTYGEEIEFDNTEWSVTSGNIANGDVLPVSLSTTYDNTTNAGTYNNAIKCSVDTTLEVAKNYSITYAKGSLKVNQRNITIKPNVHTSVYGDRISLVNTNWFVSSGIVVNGDSFNVVLSTNAEKGDNVGEDYTISLTATELNGKANYIITCETNKYIITPKDIEITISNQDSVFGKDIILRNRYTLDDGFNLERGDTLNIVTTTSATRLSPIGDYPISFVSHDNPNYNIAKCTNGWLNIKGLEVVIEIIEKQFNYGDDIVLDSTLIQSQEDISSLDIELTTIADNYSPIGRYEVIATTSNPNVVLSYDGDNKVVINPRPLNVTIENQTISYGLIELDEDAYSLGVTANNETVEIELYSNAQDFDNVGDSYSISARTTNANYTLVFDSAKLTISKKEITITLEDQEHEYSKVELAQDAYSLSEQPYNGDNLNIAILTNDANSGIGTNYVIYFTFVNDNYNVTGDNATLVIVPLPIEIEILQNVEYGKTLVFDENAYVVKSENQVRAGDNLNLEIKTNLEPNLPVNKYDIEVISNNENYNVTFISSQVQITKKALTISAPNIQSEYGEVVDENTLTASFSEELVGEDSIAIQFSIDQDYLLGIGDYVITFTYTGEDVNNYEITKENGNLNVYARYVKIEIQAQRFGYNDPIDFKNLYLDVENRILYGDNLHIVLSTEAKQGDPVGRYEIKYSYSNDNYNVEFIENYVYIEEGTLIIELLPQSFVYGEEIALDNMAFTVSEGVDKNALGVSLTTNARKYDNVGDGYYIDGTCANGNYEVVIVKANLTITQRPISLTLQNQEMVYGTPGIDTTKFSLIDDITSNSISNTQVKVSLGSGATSTSEAGRSYPISFDWVNKNYYVTAKNSANVVIIKRNIVIQSIQQGVYGSSFEYNAGYQVKEGIVVNGDDLLLKFSTNATKYSNVDEYELYIDSSNNNYNVTLNENSKFVLNPKYIQISIQLEKYYGEKLNLDNVSYRVESGALVDKDTLNLTVETSARQESSIGDYAITLKSHNPNYDVDVKVGTVKVCPRIIVIQAIKQGEYGSYFALDNTFEVVEGSLAFETDDLGIKFTAPSANNTSSVGNYDLVMTYTNRNYNVELNHLSHFEITRRKLTFELENQFGTYGDAVEINQNAYRLKYGSIVNYDIVNVDLYTTASDKSNAGTYLIYGEIDNDNYTAKFTDATYTINKRQITIQLNKQRTTRGLTFEIDQNAWELVEGNIIDGDSINVEIYTNAKKLSMIGNYKLMANVNSDNYEVNVIEGKLFLNISFIDVAVLLIVVVVIIVITVKIIKRKKEKQDNQKLFDKWIKW